MRGIKEQRWTRIACDEALIKQRNRCRYCDSRITRSQATADHYESRRDHGSNQKKNIVAACAPCNVAKGPMHGDDFLKLLKAREPETFYGVKLRASIRRIELASQAAQRRVLALVGMRFER